MIPGSCTDIVVDPADIFPEKPQGKKLGPDEDKEDGKQGEYTVGCPHRTEYQPHHHEKNPESNAETGNNSADNAQQSQRKGGHTGQQVKFRTLDLGNFNIC